MKKFSVILILIVILSSFIAGAFAASGIKSIKASINELIQITFNGKDFKPRDDKGKAISPIVYNGRTYVPLKDFCDLLGVDVKTDTKSNKIILSTALVIKQDPAFESSMKSKVKYIDKYSSVVFFNDSFYGINDGSIYSSKDAVDWTKCFTAQDGTARELLFAGQHLYANVINEHTGSHVYQTTDGQNWVQCNYNKDGDPYNTYGDVQLQFEAIGFYNDVFYAKSWETICSSVDGVTWQFAGHFHAGDCCTLNIAEGLIFYGGDYIKEGPPSIPASYIVSDTKDIKPSNDYMIIEAAYGDGTYLAVTGGKGILLSSADGQRWDRLSEERQFTGIIYDGRRFVATGFNLHNKEWTGQMLYFIEKADNKWVINEMPNPYDKVLDILFAKGSYYIHR